MVHQTKENRQKQTTAHLSPKTSTKIFQDQQFSQDREWVFNREINAEIIHKLSLHSTDKGEKKENTCSKLHYCC